MTAPLRIKILGVNSLLFLITLFVGAAFGLGWLIGSGMILYFATVAYCMGVDLKRSNVDVPLFIAQKYEESREEKKRGLQLLYGVTLPLMAVGLIFVVLIIIAMFVLY